MAENALYGERCDVGVAHLTLRRRSAHESTIRHGLGGNRRKPVIAYRKSAGQTGKDRQSFWRECTHDVVGYSPRQCAETRIRLARCKIRREIGEKSFICCDGRRRRIDSPK